MDSPINDRKLSVKLTEEQIRNNYKIRSAKAARASSRDWRTRDNFCNCFSGRGDCDTDSKEFDNEPHRWRRNIPAIWKNGCRYTVNSLPECLLAFPYLVD